jgi:hypothetical protein
LKQQLLSQHGRHNFEAIGTDVVGWWMNQLTGRNAALTTTQYLMILLA